MPKIASLVSKLARDFPAIPLEYGGEFFYDSTRGVVLYGDDGDDAASYLLHEIGHALLGHSEYDADIELVRMERDAWTKARELGRTLGVAIDEEVAEDAMDSYREWMHKRSTCPRCTATGVQEAKKTYLCILCTHRWQVNDAKTCRLYRRSIKNHPPTRYM